MSANNLLVVFFFAVGMVSCSSSSPSTNSSSDSGTELLCDGSQRFRLGVAQVVDPYTVSSEYVLVYENGYRFFYVNGDCQYWVSLGYGRYRTGKLSNPEEFSDDFLFGKWKDEGLVRSWGPPEGSFDLSPTRFLDGTSTFDVTCFPDCSTVDAPSEIVRMWNAEGKWSERLWTAGQPVVGPLRISVLDDPALLTQRVDLSGVEAASWPLSVSLSSLAVSGRDIPALMPGQSHLISDPIDVSRLVTIWETYLSGSHGLMGTYPPVPFRDGDKLYGVVMRDTVPLEGTNGLVVGL